MQKSVKRIICILVILIMIIAVAGCGQKKAQPSGSASKSSTTSSAVKSATATTSSKTTVSESSEATPTEEQAPIDVYRNFDQSDWDASGDDVSTGEGSNTIVNNNNIDFGGRAIICTSWDPSHIPKLGGLPSEEKVFRAWKAAETAYNCKFEWEIKSVNTYADDFTAAALAGVKFADVFHTQSLFSIPRHTKNNLIAPLDDIINFSDPLWEPSAPDVVKWAGKHYGIPPAKGYWGPCLLFNRDIFARDGLQDPQDLYDQGNWNWDTMLDIATQATLDTNGDGEVDTYGLSGWPQTVLHNLVLSNGASWINIDANNNYSFDLNQPTLIRALQFGTDLYNTYKVASINASDTFYTNGQTSAMMMGEVWYTLALTRPNGMYNTGIVPLPMGPDVTQCQNWEPVSTFNAFQSGIPDLENIVKMMVDISTLWDPSKPEYFDPSEGVYNTLKDITDNPRDAQIFFDLNMKNPVKLTNLDGFTDLKALIDGQLLADIIMGTKTIGAAMEAYQEQGTALFNQYIN